MGLLICLAVWGGVSILDGFVNQDGRYARATRKTVTIINQKRCPFINISLHMSSWAGRTESDSCCSPHIQRQQMCIVRSGVESRNCPSCITQLNIHPPTQFAGPTAQRRVWFWVALQRFVYSILCILSGSPPWTLAPRPRRCQRRS